MAESSKWLEAGEERSSRFKTEKNLSGASYELREAAASTKNCQKHNFPYGL
jgi:hypothetical protein